MLAQARSSLNPAGVVALACWSILRPRESIATATWTSLWVSTPMITVRGSSVLRSVMVVRANPSSMDPVGEPRDLLGWSTAQ